MARRYRRIDRCGRGCSRPQRIRATWPALPAFSIDQGRSVRLQPRCSLRGLNRAEGPMLRRSRSRMALALCRAGHWPRSSRQCRGDSDRREWSPFREELTVEDRRLFEGHAPFLACAKGAAPPRCAGNSRITRKLRNLKDRIWRGVWDDFRNWAIRSA